MILIRSVYSSAAKFKMASSSAVVAEAILEDKLADLWVFEQVKPSTVSRVFTDLLSNSHKRLSWFSPGYEGTENMFYFLS